MSINKRLISTGAGAITCTTDSTDPFGDSSGVALYNLDYDASTAPDGTDYSGSPTNVEFGVGGKINYGARFNGSSSYIDLGTSLLGSRSAFSVSTWVNFDNINTQNFIFYNSESGTGGNVGFYDFGNGSIYFQPDASTSANRGYISNSGIYTTDEWVHIVMVFDGSATGNSNRLKAYIQGTERTLNYDGTIPSSTGTSTANSWIGGRSSTKFSGDIDQVRVFSKALSPDEVDELFAEAPCVYECTTDTVNYPTTNLAYYKLDNSAEDETGSYDGTESNIEYRFGRFGQAAVFNGSSSRIATGLTLPADSTMSFSFWLKSASNSSGNNYFLSDFDSAANNNSSRLSLAISTNNGFRIWISDGSSNWNSTDDIDLSSYVNLWMNLVVVINGTDVKVYINGGTPTTLTSSVAFGTAGSRQQHIGRAGDYNGGGYYEGSIDQVRIYSTALTSSQVTELYEEKPCADTSNFKAVLYEGNGGTQYISNVGFDLDVDNGGDGGLVWIKVRSASGYNHNLFDTIRGATYRLMSNISDAQDANGKLTSFDANGFSLGAGGDANPSQSMVAWVWKSGGEAVQNNDGTIQGANCIVSANTEAGFSIVKYTGNATAGATVGHGLDYPPDLIIVKSLDLSKDWYVFSELLGQSGGEYQFLELNDSPAANTFNTQQVWNGVLPTSDVFTLTGGSADNTINDDYIAYCWHSVAEYSKIGTYTGNGSTTGTIVSLDFAPSFVVIKGTDQTSDWIMIDNKRDTTNPNSARIDANSSGAEYTGENIMDLNTDGFQLKTSSSSKNGLDKVFIYMAFK
jgi:hypothetical protein